MRAKKKLFLMVAIVIVGAIFVMKSCSKILSYEALYTNGMDQGSWIVTSTDSIHKYSVETRDFSKDSFVVVSIWNEEEGLQVGREILFMKNGKQTQRLKKKYPPGKYIIEYSIYGTISPGWIIVRM